MTARTDRDAHSMLEQTANRRKPGSMPRRNRSELSPLAAFIYGGLVVILLLVALGGAIGWFVGGKP